MFASIWYNWLISVLHFEMHIWLKLIHSYRIHTLVLSMRKPLWCTGCMISGNVCHMWEENVDIYPWLVCEQLNYWLSLYLCLITCTYSALDIYYNGFYKRKSVEISQFMTTDFYKKKIVSNYLTCTKFKLRYCCLLL